MKRSIMILAIGLLALGLGACGSGKNDPESEADSADKKSVGDDEKGQSEKKPDKKVEKKAAKVSTDGPKPVRPSMEKLSASHILLMHAESKRKPPEVTRTKDEAKKLADDLHKQLVDGADFAELAKENSDCPSGKMKGGDLGIFPARRMAPEFSEGVKSVKVGEITGPVETDFGYHIIKRQEVMEVHARHILIMHAESKRKPASITRTKDEAKKLIEELAGKITDGGDFETLAKEHSDCPSGKRRGGDLGSFGKGKMAPPFEKAAFELDEKQVSGVVETDFGFHIIQRLP